jgi:hypothetical protein
MYVATQVLGMRRSSAGSSVDMTSEAAPGMRFMVLRLHGGHALSCCRCTSATLQYGCVRVMYGTSTSSQTRLLAGGTLQHHTTVAASVVSHCNQDDLAC